MRSSRDAAGMKGRIRAIVAGHICLDITPRFPAAFSGGIEPGTLVRMEGVDIHSGGAVANVGLAMRVFGLDALLMGKVGKDAFGEMVLGILRGYGADPGMVVDEAASTSYSVVIAPPGKDRTFLHDPGPNDSFSVRDLDMDAVRDAAVFHFGYPPVMASMYEDGGAGLAEMLRAVDEAGTVTSLDMCSVDPDSAAGGADWNAILKLCLPYVDLFLPSLEELAFMLDRTAFESLRSGAIKGRAVDELAGRLAERCLGSGAKFVLIKMGERGLLCRGGGSAGLERAGRKAGGLSLGEWAGARLLRRCYEPSRVLSATGAGDSAIAAFIAAMLGGKALERCMELAAAAGASCVEAWDALSGLKPLGELERKIDAGWMTLDAED